MEHTRPIAPAEESSIDFRKILRLCKKHWYLFLLGLALAAGGAFAFMRYTIPVYQTTLRLLIKDGNSTGQYSEAQILTELGLRPAAKNYENEILILRSVPLIEQVVDKLNLQFRYWVKGRVRITDIYRNSPVEVTLWEPAQPNFNRFVLEIEDRGNNQYGINLNDKTYLGEYGTTAFLPVGQLILSRIPSRSSYIDRPVYIEFRMPDEVARDLSTRIHASLSNRHTTILQISLTDPVPQQAEDILNALAIAYSELEVREQNQIYQNTIRFIDERLEILALDLKEVRDEFPENGITIPQMDFNDENSKIKTEIARNNRELTDWEVQIQILNTLEQSLKNQQDHFEYIPTNITLANPTLSAMINRLNELQVEREKLSNTLGPNHPNLHMLEKQLTNMRDNILGNIAILRNDMEVQRNAIDTRREGIRGRITTIPRQKLEVLDVKLQQQIKQNLYSFLLQKKEEISLKLAATISSRVVVEDAYSNLSLVKPNEIIVYRNALGMGLVFPLALLVLISVFNNKIESVEDIKKITRVPVSGTILQGKKKIRIVIREKSRSAMAELFRLLRTNLHFVSPETRNQVFLVTSVIPGEGKSFVCLNLGMTMALAGKKTLVIELDLRKPTLIDNLGWKEQVSKGLTQYLADEGIRLEEIIHQADLHPNLYVIASGPIPPDPGELILSDRLRKLMEAARDQFDVILIDSSPVGVVADSLLLKELVDTTLFIVRHNRTLVEHLKLIEEIFRMEKLPRPQIVFNGVKNGGGSFGYGYKVRHGYYQED